MEQVIVRYDYEPVYEEYTAYECGRCRATLNSYDALAEHLGITSGHFDTTKPCFSSNWYFGTVKKQTGENKIPVYENQWVVDTPDSTIRICSVCGHQE